MKNMILSAVILLALGMSSCQNKIDEKEDKKVEEMLKTDQERSDSAKRALGIQE